MKNTEELKQIARQLGNPSGERGAAMGREMYTKNQFMIQCAIESLRLSDQDKVLELGHGNAHHLPMILQAADKVCYRGLEISSTMQQEAQEFLQTNFSDSDVEFRCYEGISIPFESTMFDKLVTVNTIYFWEDPLRLLEECHRVLKPEGLFVVTFAAKEFMKQLPFSTYGFKLYEVEEVEALLKEKGFSLQSAEVKSEEVVAATGQLVQRNFIVMSFLKR